MFLFLFSALCCKRHLDFSLLDKLDKRLEEDFLLSLQVNKAPEGQKKEAGTNAEEKRRDWDRVYFFRHGGFLKNVAHLSTPHYDNMQVRRFLCRSGRTVSEWERQHFVRPLQICARGHIYSAASHLNADRHCVVLYGGAAFEEVNSTVTPHRY